MPMPGTWKGFRALLVAVTAEVAFAGKLIERYGVAVDVCIHRPDRKGDQRNHHAHLLMITRSLGPDGFGKKTRELDESKGRGPGEIEAIRQLWERGQNQALELAGSAERVSRLSNAAQGLDREPQPKMGKAAIALMRRGEPSHMGERLKEVANRNAMRENAARVSKARDAEWSSQHSPMRQNMAKQAEQRHSAKVEAEKQEAVARALEAAARQQSMEYERQQAVSKKNTSTQTHQDHSSKSASTEQHGKAQPPNRRFNQTSAPPPKRDNAELPKEFNAEARRKKLIQERKRIRTHVRTRQRVRSR